MRLLIPPLMMLGWISIVAAQPATTSTGHAATKPADPPLSVTAASVVIDGRSIDYRATAGQLPLNDPATGKPRANLFFVAYEKIPVDNTAQRPITFVFNGGPGAAAVWLHLGAAGPRRIDVNPDDNAPAPPYRLVENESAWLDFTDLVFIDPPGTGYSRLEPGAKREDFFGVEQDVRAVADFIRLYVTRYRRWLSPKFLAGESYGTTRAAALAQHLHEVVGLDLNGIVLISVVLDFQTISFDAGNDLPYVLYLPAYTAAAWKHRRLEESLQKDFSAAMEESETFAIEDYGPALARGSALNDSQRQAIIAKLSRLTGLDAKLIDQAELRVPPWVFQKALLDPNRKIIGRFDATITGPDADPLQRAAGYDPSLSRYLGVYTAAMNAYARETLEYENDLPYEVLSGLVHPWDFGRDGQGYLSVSDKLASAMVRNPHLQVMFASGRFDLATPYFACDYTLRHLDLPPELRPNLVQHRYDAGHMMYHDPASRRKLHDDIARFVRQSLQPATAPSR